MPIADLLLQKLVDLGAELVSRSLRASRSRLAVNADDIDSAIRDHLAQVDRWSSEVSFGDLSAPKRTVQAYIPLEVLLTPRRRRISDDDSTESVELDRLFALPTVHHVIVLGQPGAGKTTSAKYLCQRLIHDPEFLPDRFRLPLVIRLRELRVQNVGKVGGPPVFDGLFPALQELLRLRLSFPDELMLEESDRQRRSIRDQAVLDFIDSLRCVLVLDGWDEIPLKTHREAVLQECRTLASSLQQSALLLTSRTGEFGYHIENTAQFELGALTTAQVASFACRWLGEDEGGRFLSELQKSPFADTALRPLTIAHLCAIFERENRIPPRPKTVYRKIVGLLLEDWDVQRSVLRQTAYGGFEPDRKAEFLAHLSYYLTTTVRQSVFSKNDLVRAYEVIRDNFGLPQGEALRVANELESHTGLFVQAGFESFEFSHKSIQEYLTAEHIVKLPTIPSDGRILSLLPNELAVASAISSSPSEYFSELVLSEFRRHHFRLPFVRTFVNRLLVEKPDFDRSRRVGVALLVLYSHYVHLVLRDSEQLHFILVDQLAREFEQLGQLVGGRLSSERLLQAYEVRDTLTAVDGLPIVRLARLKRVRADLTFGPERILPSELYVRPTLLAAEGDSAGT